MTIDNDEVHDGAPVIPPDPWAVRVLVPALGVLLCLIALSLSMELHLVVNDELYPQQGFAFILGLALAIIFLKVPANRETVRSRIPWYDAALTIISICATVYFSYRFQFIQDNERIITIEDAAELKLKKSHWERLEPRLSQSQLSIAAAYLPLHGVPVAG